MCFVRACVYIYIVYVLYTCKRNTLVLTLLCKSTRISCLSNNIINNNSPDAVLMDTEIIAESPLRFTVAGLGDAMSTFYEARAVRASGGTNLSGGHPCVASWALVSALRDTLLKVAPQAIKDLKDKKVSPAVEKIIEANSLLSGTS